ncbi:MAG: hypothetical protein FWH23_00215 [Bacteroidales bacterium]|nr:hypothetical protein [Bacteroidales bacterium]MCL2132840.1 hypothetical protein [Bacteroidales bacterium]
MKKLLLLACVSVIAFSTVRAQEESLSAGSLMFQTSITGLEVQFTDDFNLSLVVRGGYFIADKLPILAGVGLQHVKDFATTLGLQAGIGYFITNGLYLNALGTLNYISLEGYMMSGNVSVFGIIGELGYALFLNKHIAIDPKLVLEVPFKEGYKTSLGLGCGFTIFF